MYHACGLTYFEGATVSLMRTTLVGVLVTKVGFCELLKALHPLSPDPKSLVVPRTKSMTCFESVLLMQSTILQWFHENVKGTKSAKHVFKL